MSEAKTQLKVDGHTTEDRIKKKSEDSSSDRFDPAQLRLSQDFAKEVGVKKVLMSIPVRKPGKQDFVRVHPDPDYQLNTMILELKEERESYLVAPQLQTELYSELVPKTLYPTVNRQGVLTLWPVRLPGEDGRLDEWNTTAHEAARMAIRIRCGS